ncbi:hypothetical protein LA327_02335 [Thomasclavelia ramosa]|uniref:hypothetical protein n=1 Tax=Thomasclavelia ramosa TaxID=1547 RepID=UPI00024A57E6|nr:hypothetical protein [Thomasclavelia ramosa]EHQ46160.1 hypothetical protein HMPREF0978_02204 [Coprobacillus sp. 8_2_54BFAA]DAE62413.1 MAG TPA: holin [Caudoviricetes sp.]MCR1948544.1 hypothetical protein [Thomasclavelia ramosa]QQY28089.1 hypothetical protein I6I63_02430 [Thomasclavelia ramosa]UBH44921.1 hypothetical protein LA327_02335 [Thomasclavelia ramosa]
MESIYITIISSLLSGIVATFITVIYYKRQERRQRKLDLLASIMRNINAITRPIDENRKTQLAGFLNEAFIVFNENSEILRQLENLKENVTNEKLIKVVKLMCQDLKIDYTNLTDEFISKPFK